MPSAGGSDGGDGSVFISGQTRNNKYVKGTEATQQPVQCI
jgi:hypothetical protein